MLVLPACCHLLSSPATSAAAALLAKTRPEVARGLEVIVWRILSNQSLRFSLVALWSINPPRLHVAKIPIGVATTGCSEWGDTYPYARSGRSFLDSNQFPTSIEPFTPVMRDTPSPRPTVSAMTMLAPIVIQESTLSHNKFALCLQSLLRPSSALSACEFATRMQALIPSPVPACLPLLPRPSLALSPSEFKSVYMRVLTPTHVPAGFRQSGSRPGPPAWPITGLTTRVF